MKAVVRRVIRDFDVAFDDIDISTDPELERRYGLDIPVLLLDETKVAKYRIGEGDLRRMLGARSRTTSP
jgi:hypothetical protein